MSDEIPPRADMDQLRSGFQSWVNPLLSAGVGIAPGHCIVNFRAENAEKERDVARAGLAKAQAGAAEYRDALAALLGRVEHGCCAGSHPNKEGYDGWLERARATTLLQRSDAGRGFIGLEVVAKVREALPELFHRAWCTGYTKTPNGEAEALREALAMLEPKP